MTSSVIDSTTLTLTAMEEEMGPREILEVGRSVRRQIQQFKGELEEAIVGGSWGGRIEKQFMICSNKTLAPIRYDV